MYRLLWDLEDAYLSLLECVLLSLQLSSARLIGCSVEKVHVVWNPGKPRFHTWIYIFCLANVLAYIVPVILMIIGMYLSRFSLYP